MSNAKKSISRRFMAALLSFVLVLGLIPTSALTAYAATPEHPNGVTVSVTDQDGKGIAGATVEYHINSTVNGADYASGTATTDETGCAEVLAADKFIADDLTLSATAVLADYTYADGSGSIKNAAITSDAQDFAIQLRSTKIPGVTVTANSGLVYQEGTAQSLVTVAGTKDTDTVTYKIDNDVVVTPQKIDAGTYAVEVIVAREGYSDFIFSENVTIAKAPIAGIDITEVNASYNEKTQNIVTLTGNFLPTDEVHWFVNGADTGSMDVPQKDAVGEYTVRLTVDRGNNYEVFDKTVTSKIVLGNINLDGLKITANKLTYNGEEQEAVTVEGQGNYTLQYRLSETESWKKYDKADGTVPTVKNAGDYTVYIKAVKDSYNDKEYPEFPLNVHVEKAGQNIAFSTAVPTTVELTNDSNKNRYDFSAGGNNLSGQEIEYTLIDASGTDIAEIDASNGTLTVKHAGIVTVKAFRAGNKNYKDAEAYSTVLITAPQSGLVDFDNKTVNYVLDESGVSSEQQATKVNADDNGAVTYSIDQTNIGLSIDTNSGKITVTNWNKLGRAMRKTGSVSVIVTAKKAAGKMTAKEWTRNGETWASQDVTYEVYPATVTSYKLVITYEAAPDFDAVCNITSSDPETGWYNSEYPATVTPKDSKRYSIAVDDPIGFADEQTITAQGEDSHYIYLKDKTTRKICAAIELKIKIDTVAPNTRDMTISYSESSESIVDKILSTITFGYYNPDVTVTFTAKDETSGLDHMDWKYTKEANASDINLLKDGGPLTFDKNGQAVLTLTASELEQYRGNISFTVTDKAGNTSDVKTDDDHVIVIDTIPPKCSVSYADPLNIHDGKKYFDGSIELNFTVTEANFYEEDFKAFVSKNGESKVPVSLSWEKSAEEKDTYIGTYMLSGDGDYVVSAEYEDRSNNEMAKYQSDVLVVDTIAPTMTVEYSEASNQVGTTLYYGNDKSGKAEITFKVTEANFFAEDVVVKVSKNGATAYAVTPAWTDVDADTHIGSYTISGDGHYIVSVEYKDRSNNKMTTYQSDMITIDTIKPQVNVTYQNTAKIATLKDSEGADRDYFNKTQTAVVTINEHNFDSNDIKFNIVGKDVAGNMRNISDLISMSSWRTNGDVHSITITYSGDANYTFDVDYSDLAKNAAEDYVADHFTVDTVAPRITGVSYSTSVLETVLSSVSFGFYNAKMTVTVTAEDDTAGIHQFNYSYLTAAGVSSVNAQLLDQVIDEAGIKYSDGGRTATMTFEIPKMALGSDNQFNGTVKFDATDRSDNKVEQSENKRIVVDNIAPTATVSYNEPVNTQNGISYYDGNINGTITINEANFYAEDVSVMVSRDGGAAQTLATSWSDSSVDTHIGSFTLTDDADYIVTINYRDKSGNTMTEYQSSQMTIDTKIEEPTYSINGVAKSGDDGGAYKDEANISFNFEDQNFDTQTVKLVRTRFNETKDVTADFVKVGLNEKGGSGSFDVAKKVDNDGIYVLTVTMTDKAGHSTESHIKFTINRYGSVYEYSDYLTSLIKNQSVLLVSIFCLCFAHYNYSNQ